MKPYEFGRQKCGMCLQLTHLFYLWASLLKYVLVPLIFPKIHGLTMVHAPQISLLLLAPVLAAKNNIINIEEN